MRLPSSTPRHLRETESGLPPAKAALRFAGWRVFVIRDGKISRVTTYYNLDRMDREGFEERSIMGSRSRR